MDTIKQLEYQKKANLFWENHFSQYMDDRIDEQIALHIDLWDKIKIALESESTDVVESIIFSKITLPITSNELALRIIKIAKRVWDKKRAEEE